MNVAMLRIVLLSVILTVVWTQTFFGEETTLHKPLAEWVNASGGSVPFNAIEVGYDWDLSVVYVARAHHKGDTIPGKFVPELELCFISWKGQEFSYAEYEVLVDPDGVTLEWIHANGSDIPPGAVQGGITADGELLYIGRVSHKGAMCSGKVHPSHGVLYIPYRGQEYKYSTYEILVYKSINP